jgi:hypothetical protein
MMPQYEAQGEPIVATPCTRGGVIAEGGAL